MLTYSCDYPLRCLESPLIFVFLENRSELTAASGYDLL
jgi:hypothetical protein